MVKSLKKEYKNRIKIYFNGRKEPVILEMSDIVLKSFMSKLYSESHNIIRIGKLSIIKGNIDYVEL